MTHTAKLKDRRYILLIIYLATIEYHHGYHLMVLMKWSTVCCIGKTEKSRHDLAPSIRFVLNVLE